MSHRGQESQPGYVDGISVKISEKYKPPPRINLACSYSQRLSLNQQIQDNAMCYEFTLEKNIKQTVRELKNARKMLKDDASERLEKIKLARQKYLESKTKDENLSTDNEMFVTSRELDKTKQDEQAPETNSILYPNYSHILMPTPLIKPSQTLVSDSNDKSPFNIAEFEADTSSPFDNMELKTINDIEELAQVLKKDKTINSFSTPYTTNQTYSNYVPQTNLTTQQSNYIGQENIATNSNYTSFNIPQSSVANLITYGQTVSTRMYDNTNGSFYTPQNYNLSTVASTEENKKMKSVPDIMKSLRAELKNTHVNNVNKYAVNESHKPDINKMTHIQDEVYESLPTNLQILCKNVSSMGFPLSRVARVCQVLGDDHKKVVEHLLVMSELLDLGFREQDVSAALLRCNNDRDKALDILIS